MIASRLAVAGHAWVRGWPAVTQLTADAVLSWPYFAFVLGVILGFAAIPVALLGVVGLALLAHVAFVVAYLERARLFAVLGVRVAAPVPVPGQPLWRTLLLDGRRWLALVHVCAMSVWGFVAGSALVLLAGISLALAALPFYVWWLPDQSLAMPGEGVVTGWWLMALLALLGAVGLLATPFVARVLSMVDVMLVRRLLGPGESEQVARLSRRVEALDRTRAATVDSVELERRRIERDLHDGPQQRLVAIAMDLGMAREKLGDAGAAAPDLDGARALVDGAHVAAKDAITDMRQVARGIHPPVLTDRGLAPALSALAARCPVPVELHVDVPRRPTRTVEAIAYFSVSEALTNVAKHSHARAARVDVVSLGDRLGVHVSDNGVGGADPSRGTGLTGLADRAAAVDGSLEVSSPPGGPTALTVTLPTRGAS